MVRVAVRLIEDAFAHLCIEVNISVADHDILIDTHLRLKENVHYGLVGRNGEGKSSMFRFIMNHTRLLSFPPSVVESHRGQAYPRHTGESTHPPRWAGRVCAAGR